MSKLGDWIRRQTMSKADKDTMNTLQSYSEIIANPNSSAQERADAEQAWTDLVNTLDPSLQTQMMANGLHGDVNASGGISSVVTQDAFKAQYSQMTFWQKIKFNITHFTWLGWLLIVGIVLVIAVIIWLFVWIGKKIFKKSAKRSPEESKTRSTAKKSTGIKKKSSVSSNESFGERMKKAREAKARERKRLGIKKPPRKTKKK